MTASTPPFFFVFDMDETLAEVYSLYYLLEDAIKHHPPSAYRAFVQSIATNDYGILRPGIRRIMEQLHALQQVGKVGGVLIYSNNSHLTSLKFIRDVIHAHLQTTDPLIIQCIHWLHPHRTDAPHRNDKTWDSLQRFLPEGIEPDRVFFVDDLDHTDLRTALGPHYIKVQPYSYHPPFGILLDAYDATLQSVGEPPLTQEDRDRLEKKTEPYESKEPPADPGFEQQMAAAIHEVIDTRTGGRKRKGSYRHTQRLQRVQRMRRQKKRRTKKGRHNRE
jgi:hypothetical protein